MKLLFHKKGLESKEIIEKGLAKKKFFTKKKIISIVSVLLVIVLGVTIYKVKFAKTKTTQSSVKYTVLKKTNIASTISSSGAIKSGDSTNIYSNLEYNVASINVEIGDVVKKGDILATIDTSTLQEQLSEAEQTLAANEQKNNLSLASAQQKYENLKYLHDNNLQTDVINAEKAVDSAKLDMESKSRTYEYDKVMFQNGEISKEDLSAAETNYENAKGAYDKATVALEATKVNAEQSLAEAKTAYESAQATANDKSSRLAYEDKKKKLEDAQVVATVDGTVTNVNAVVGVQASGALFVIQDLNNLIVNASVDETDVAKVKVGQRVEITTDASGADIIPGQVVSVEPVSSTASASTSSTSTSSGKTSTSTSTTSNSTSSDVSFTVKVQLTGHNDKVKVGMNSVVNIITDEKDDVYSVPYGAVTKSNGQDVVYAAVKQDKQYVVKEIPITKGIESSTNVEIEGSDLSDGLFILTDPANYHVGDAITIETQGYNRKTSK
ncbi:MULTISPECIES: efflux RND transporter periplasmic adaptor subunit [unclassified Clostridium]|uniref:efflux RND transporter periplasmic adaptor subunit n=1 Tax=unclassified Clostridium TaxID=2614128 RepID=UPI000297D7FB|nr:MULTISPECIES: efflux RND transporter periplasmic adaptor subunit [unclassified Clostridium]EKQ57023.1 MAG: multidrug resistance efflux pump [Clostridium sp. Maddingley MBC34-26]